MNLKKAAAALGVIICIALLILVGIQVITWRLFWVILLLVGGFAYFVLPKMND